jgi:hypothetical protein
MKFFDAVVKNINILAYPENFIHFKHDLDEKNKKLFFRYMQMTSFKWLKIENLAEFF